MAEALDAAGLTARLGGGVVSAITPSPDSARHAFLWSPREFPMWYRLGLVQADGGVALAPSDHRLWGRPRWAPSGHLAAGGLIGIRRTRFDVTTDSLSLNPIAPASDASYELVGYLGHGSALCRRRSLDGSVALVRTGVAGDLVVATERGPLPAWRNAELVRWHAQGCALEGVFVRPAEGEAPWPTVVFLHGGPVATLAVGEQERVGAWTDPRWATFVPEFCASGICGEAAMLAAFEARELPDDDHEVDAMLAGIDTLVAAGRSDPQRLLLVGHSYGAYLVNRALTRTSRFRAAVCWEGVADLRLLDAASLDMQARWRGGSPAEVPERWSAASPIDRAERVCTPTLLVYGGGSGLVDQGGRWHDALRRAGVSTELVVVDAAAHTFETQDATEEFHERVTVWSRRHGGA